MKKVKLTTKLNLNKEKVSGLNEGQMYGIIGGGELSVFTDKEKKRPQGRSVLSIGKLCTNTIRCASGKTVSLFCTV